MRLNKDRTVLLAYTNMGAPLDGICSVEHAKSFMIQGLVEGYCGQDCDDGKFYQRPPMCNEEWGSDEPSEYRKWEMAATDWAFDCWNAEYASWMKLLKEYDGKPLPDYWAEIDAKLDEWEVRQV